jgi:hypothetical protein
MAASHILECLWEEHASYAGPWVQNLARPVSLQPQAIPPAAFFCFWRVCNVHIYISTYVNIQRYQKTRVLTSPHSYTPTYSEMGFLGSGYTHVASPMRGTHRRSS